MMRHTGGSAIGAISTSKPLVIGDALGFRGNVDAHLLAVEADQTAFADSDFFVEPWLLSGYRAHLPFLRAFALHMKKPAASSRGSADEPSRFRGSVSTRPIGSRSAEPGGGHFPRLSKQLEYCSTQIPACKSFAEISTCFFHDVRLSAAPGSEVRPLARSTAYGRRRPACGRNRRFARRPLAERASLLYSRYQMPPPLRPFTPRPLTATERTP